MPAGRLRASGRAGAAEAAIVWLYRRWIESSEEGRMLGADVDLTLEEDEVIMEEASFSRDPFTTAEAVCCCIIPGGRGWRKGGVGVLYT